MRKLYLIAFLFLASMTLSQSAEASRCYCKPYLSQYELFYVDSDGIPRFIFRYNSYGECLAGLDRTLLCHRGGASLNDAVERADEPQQLTCDQIRSYCYNMWIIRRRNYQQYVGCVYSNAENNNLSCSP